MPWTEEMVEGLRQMWIEGLTANEIAKKLGVSKNSIVGKVHRLCLTARPSPIKKKDEEIAAEIVKEKVEVITIETKPQEEEITVETEIATVVPAKKKTVAEQRVKLINLDSHTCRWPIGDPRDDDFCFCGKKVRAGQTYCDEHSMLAYVKANTKR